ncbi:MAG: cell division protein FtsA [Alphaproteobacteria bacterium]
MARGNGELITALDVGSTKVCCFIARDEGDDTLRVAGIGHQVSQGIRSGRVVDMDAVESSILSAVHAAEQMAGGTIHKVILNVSGGAPSSNTVTADIAISGRQVSDGDIVRAFEHAQNGIKLGDREIIHALPAAYRIDNEKGIREPRGMYGARLGVDVHLISVAAGALKTLKTCVAHCHLDVVSPVVSPYASGLASLVDDEMTLGATVIDMGGGTTSIATFYEGEMIYTDTIPIGGIHVTNDIARGLSTPTMQAERMKTLMGSAIPSPRDEREFIEVPSLGEGDANQTNPIPRSMLIGIIRPRLEETFELVRNRLNASGFGHMVGRRAVLTGGASQLQGIPELAGQVLGKQVRLGRPWEIQGLAEATGGPAFSTCAGLLLYAKQKHLEQARTAAGRPEGAIRSFGRIGQWLRQNF